MSKGTTGDRALVKMLANANKLDNTRFKNLGDATLKRIAARARSENANFAGDGQKLASRALREINARKKKGSK